MHGCKSLLASEALRVLNDPNILAEALVGRIACVLVEHSAGSRVETCYK